MSNFLRRIAQNVSRTARLNGLPIEIEVVYETEFGEEIELTVEGTYISASPATYDHPGDPAEVEIVNIFGPDGKPFKFPSVDAEKMFREEAEEALVERVSELDGY